MFLSFFLASLYLFYKELDSFSYIFFSQFLSLFIFFCLSHLTFLIGHLFDWIFAFCLWLVRGCSSAQGSVWLLSCTFSLMASDCFTWCVFALTHGSAWFPACSSFWLSTSCLRLLVTLTSYACFKITSMPKHLVRLNGSMLTNLHWIDFVVVWNRSARWMLTFLQRGGLLLAHLATMRLLPTRRYISRLHRSGCRGWGPWLLQHLRAGGSGLEMSSRRFICQFRIWLSL